MASSMTTDLATRRGCLAIQASSSSIISGSRVTLVGLRMRFWFMSCMNAHLHNESQMSIFVRTLVDTSSTDQ